MEEGMFCVRNRSRLGACSSTELGLPDPIKELFHDREFKAPTLLFAVAEHKVRLYGLGHASQCDVWAVIETAMGGTSLAVEAKAKEKFGAGTLEDFLTVKSETKRKNRILRWNYMSKNLPLCNDQFLTIQYQILHRAAASIIEARRLKLQHAAFVVQSFGAPEESFQAYELFCAALRIEAGRGKMGVARERVGDVSLSVGWAECALATDQEVAAVA